jgi:hypothetical protein
MTHPNSYNVKEMDEAYRAGVQRAMYVAARYCSSMIAVGVSTKSKVDTLLGLQTKLQELWSEPSPYATPQRTEEA